MRVPLVARLCGGGPFLGDGVAADRLLPLASRGGEGGPEREQRGETVETTFVSIDKAEMAGAELQGKNAQIVVRFLSKLITATRDASGTVVDGSPEAVADVTDVWTFARNLGSRDPNWQLVATEAGQ